MRAIVLITILCLVTGVCMAEEITNVWVACQPDSFVNIREFPSKKADVVARIEAGEMLETDGKKKGHWLHCFYPCETGEGWIKEDFVFYDEPVILEHGNYEVTKDNVIARYSKGGRIRKKLMKGRRVHVYLLGQDWSVTSQGFIKTEFLMWLDI